VKSSFCCTQEIISDVWYNNGHERQVYSKGILATRLHLVECIPPHHTESAQCRYWHAAVRECNKWSRLDVYSAPFCSKLHCRIIWRHLRPTGIQNMFYIDQFRNLLQSSLVPVYLFTKFHEHPLITFRVILLTDKFGSKFRFRQGSVILPSLFEDLDDIHYNTRLYSPKFYPFSYIQIILLCWWYPLIASSVIRMASEHRPLLVESGHVTTPTERWLVGNVVIDTYVQRTWPGRYTCQINQLISRQDSKGAPRGVHGR